MKTQMADIHDIREARMAKLKPTSFKDAGIPEAILRAKAELHLNIVVCEIIQEFGTQTAKDMLQARVRAIEATERSGV
jgi:hypothetical protein